MQRKAASIALGLPLAFVLGSLATPGSRAEAGPTGAPDLSQAVAVVDVARVRQGYPRAKELDEAWKAQQAQVDLALKRGSQELEKLKLELSGWDPFTREWVDARQRVSATEAGLKALRDTEEQRLVIERYRNHEDVYNDIHLAISKLAKKRNLQLVLRVNPAVPDTAPLDARVEMWRSKSAFYHHDKLDLTEDVIKFLKSPEFAGGDAAQPGNGK